MLAMCTFQSVHYLCRSIILIIFKCNTPQTSIETVKNMFVYREKKQQRVASRVACELHLFHYLFICTCVQFAVNSSSSAKEIHINNESNNNENPRDSFCLLHTKQQIVLLNHVQCVLCINNFSRFRFDLPFLCINTPFA